MAIQIEVINATLTDLTRAVAQLAERFDGVDSRFDAMDARFDALESAMDRRFEKLDRNLADGNAALISAIMVFGKK